MRGEFSAIYAIGDVHGRLDLLLALEERIAEDAAGIAGNKLIVLLGDYIDRGPQSAEVIEHLLAPPSSDFTRVCLAGNHEEMMLDFLDRPEPSTDWLRYGGIDTLVSYGVSPDALAEARGSEARLRHLVEGVIPRDHLNLLAGLASVLAVPGYIFVHAGIRPGVALELQTEDDLYWIRHEFIESNADFGAIVIHGHTPVRTAEIHANRIAIDTGAFVTGVLSAVALGPGGPRILESRIERDETVDEAATVAPPN